MSNMTSDNANTSQPMISVVDLQNLLRVVDLATIRGAFRGSELSQVGQVFDKVTQFVQSVVPPQPAEPVQQQMQPVPTPVMPMTPPFSPKVGV